MIETKSPSSRFPDNTTEGNIPVKKSGAYENSNISQDPTGEIRAATKIIAEGGIDVPPATITIGDGVNIKASGPQQINESNVTGIRYQFPHQEIDKTGTQKTFNIKVLAETLNNARQPVFDTQLVSPASVPETSASNQIINAIYIRTDGDIDNFHYEIKDVTTGATADSYPNKYDYAKDVGVSIPGAGIHKIDLYYSGDSAPPRFLSGQDIILTMKWDNAGGTVLGDSLGKPFYELDTQEFEFINMVDIEDSVTTLSDVSDAGSGEIITDLERTNLGNQSGNNTGDQDLSSLALKSNVLELDNTDPFTPDADHEPATKKYADDADALATQNSDSSLTGNSYFKNDSTFSTPDANKVASELATKVYIDQNIAGVPAKENAHVATTTYLDNLGVGAWTKAGSKATKVLTAGSVGILTIDGHALELGDRIYIKDEDGSSTNLTDIDQGIYDVTAEGTAGVVTELTRSDDFNGTPSSEVKNGVYAYVTLGADNQNTGWRVLAAGDVDVDVDSMVIKQFQGLPGNHGANHTNGSDDIQNATAAQKGLATAAQITKLDAIESLAEVNQTNSEIKTQYELNADTNEFSDAEQSKLAGIAESANNYSHPNHTGEVTSLGDGALTIANDAVTLAKMADMATASLLGRNTAATGNPEVLSASTVRTLLNVEDGATADQSDPEIKTAYENNANTNVYTDAEKTKLGSLTGGRYLGVFADLTALQTAHATGVSGDSATVTSPNGNLFYWNGSAWADSGTGFIGDMNKATFDPTAKNADVFDMDNMDESATKKVLTNTERSEIAANTTHKSSDGSDHSFIDQDVKSGVSPTFDSANFTGVGGQLKVARISGSTFSTVQHMQDIFHSAGHVEGGLITDAGSNTVNGDLGKGFIRATDSRVSELLFFDWPQNLGISVPLNTTRYIGVEYNAGSPLIAARATDNFDDTTSFFLAVCVNEGGAIHIKNSPHSVGDHAANMIIRLKESMGIKRDNVTKGLIIAETGTRKITVTAGGLWDRLTRFPITSIDTSASGTFDRYFTTAPGVHTKQTAQTDWDNTQYNNVATGLVTLSNNNKYAVQWWYLELDGALLCLYGTEQHDSLAEAELEGEPIDAPDRVAKLSLLIARTIFKKSGSTLAKIESAFDRVFGGAIVTDHGSLGGLPDDDHPNSKLLNGRASDITELNAATYTLLTTDYLVHVSYTTTGAVTSLTIPTAQIAASREFTIKDGGGNAGANSITIDTEGSETINGAATLVLNTNYETVTLYSYNGNLYNR